MQELLLVTNRRTQWKVTVFGGVLMGLLIGVGLSAVAGIALYDRHQAFALSREAAIKVDYEKRLTAAGDEIKRVGEENKRLGEEFRHKEDSFSGAPVVYLAQSSRAKLLQLRTIIDKFPDFKTDSYKVVFAELTRELDKQLTDSTVLRDALVSSKAVPALRCALAPQESGSPSLWSNGTVTYRTDGWSGVGL